MEAKVNELLQYLYDNKGESYLNDVSPYYVQYISENHPESFNNIVKPENLDIADYSKIVTPTSSPYTKKYKFPVLLNEVVKESSDATPTQKSQSVNFKSKTDFIKTLIPITEKIGKEYGVDPNIILSQAAFESNYGQNTLSKKANNLFSIQGKGFEHYDKNQKGETYNTSFKSYDSLEDSVRDWAKLVLNPSSKRYSSSYNAAKLGADNFMKVHAWSGYAEGVGETKEKAKQNIYAGYKSAYNNILKLRRDNNI